MTKSHVLALSAAVAACGSFVGTPSVQAAPLTYQTAVTANNPYLYFRQQETGTLTNQLAEDSSLNNRDGIYRGTPTGGLAGAGPASDTAISYPGHATSTPPASELTYLRTTDSRSFGSQVMQSSYEFLFKSNTPGYTDPRGLFSAFNATTPEGRTGNQATAVELNFSGAGTGTPGLTRLYFRDEDGQQLFGDIAHGNLLDGNYHHLVFTADMLAENVSDKIKAYIDGIAVPVTIAQSSSGAPTDFLDFTVDPTFAARNERGVVRLLAGVTIDEAALYTQVLSAEQVAANATAAGFVVPEPGSLALVGLAGLGMLARRRRA